MINVVASGFFDPLHSGHIEYLKQAKALGDRLIVLVNSNKAAQRKKGYYFMDIEERMSIIRALAFVDEVIPAIDDDDTVASSLECIRPNIFAKGGDRTFENLPFQEIKICQKNNIDIVTNLGAKIQSSSRLVSDALLNNRVDRDWGYYTTIYYEPGIKIKILYLKPFAAISLQKHMYRDEIWVVLNGTAYVENGDSVCEYGRKDILFIKSNTLHRVTNCSGEMLVIQETQIGEHTIENDIVRVENRN